MTTLPKVSTHISQQLSLRELSYWVRGEETVTPITSTASACHSMTFPKLLKLSLTYILYLLV